MEEERSLRVRLRGHYMLLGHSVCVSLCSPRLWLTPRKESKWVPMGWMSSLMLHKVWLAGLGAEGASYSP